MHQKRRRGVFSVFICFISICFCCLVILHLHHHFKGSYSELKTVVVPTIPQNGRNMYVQLNLPPPITKTLNGSMHLGGALSNVNFSEVLKPTKYLRKSKKPYRLKEAVKLEVSGSNPYDLHCPQSAELGKLVQYWKADARDISWRVAPQPRK
jgi:hypothetical protein